MNHVLIETYQHQEVAYVLGLSVLTVVRWSDHLVKEGYILEKSERGYVYTEKDVRVLFDLRDYYTYKRNLEKAIQVIKLSYADSFRFVCV